MNPQKQEDKSQAYPSFSMRQIHFNSIRPELTDLREIPQQNKAQMKDLMKQFQQQQPIAIDYGSETIRAGYSSKPEMTFRPYVSKNRDPSRLQQPIKNSINTSYDQIDLFKQNYKSVFERNIMLHFSALQQCNDYIFSELGCYSDKKINSTLLVSEPFANPLHCRECLLEQLFECYEIQSVLVGVDSLFKLFYEMDCNLDKFEKCTSLCIDMGANTIHVFCMVDGKVQFPEVRRLNIGGNQAFELFSKSIILKNPHLKTNFTYRFIRYLYEQYTEIALDYRQQLKYFAKRDLFLNPNLYRNRIDQENKKYQMEIESELKFIEGLEIDFDMMVEIPEEQIKRKEQIKLRMAEKLKETIQRRKEMKRKLHQTELDSFKKLREKYEQHDMAAHEEVAEIFGSHKGFEKLNKKIKEIEVKLGLVEEKADEKKYSLIDIPDHELPPEKLKFKRMQIYQKKAVEERREKQRKKQEEEEKMRQLREENPEEYLKQLKEKYKALSQKMKEHERLKAEMSDRKSKYNKKKMQMIARIAEEEFNEQEYEEAEEEAQNAEEEESDHFSELDVMEAELREIDPEYSHSKSDEHHLRSANQLFLLAELVKCHEVYFQPQMVGSEQIGLVEMLRQTVGKFDSTVQQRLLENIVIVGGGSGVKGLSARLEKDLRQECAQGMDIQITVGKGGADSAYKAMQFIGKNFVEDLGSMTYKRATYKTESATNPWANLGFSKSGNE